MTTLYVSVVFQLQFSVTALALTLEGRGLRIKYHYRDLHYCSLSYRLSSPKSM